MRFVVSPRGAPIWNTAADLVLERFSEAFGATRRPNPDLFLAAQDQDSGDVLACVGVTFGLGKTFFAEHYLPASAEQVIAEHTGTPCERTEVIELGSIASAGHRAGSEIIKVLPRFAEEHHLKYGLFTANVDLATALDRIGFPFEPLATARIERLPEDSRSGWGTYYEHEPVTGVIRLERVVSIFHGADAQPNVVPINGSSFHYEAETVSATA